MHHSRLGIWSRQRARQDVAVRCVHVHMDDGRLRSTGVLDLEPGRLVISTRRSGLCRWHTSPYCQRISCARVFVSLCLHLPSQISDLLPHTQPHGTTTAGGSKSALSDCTTAISWVSELAMALMPSIIVHTTSLSSLSARYSSGWAGSDSMLAAHLVQIYELSWLR